MSRRIQIQEWRLLGQNWWLSWNDGKKRYTISLASKRGHVRVLKKFKDEDRNNVAEGFQSYFWIAMPKLQSMELAIERFVSQINRWDYENSLQWENMSFLHWLAEIKRGLGFIV
jgi:hypothetical protein